MANEPIVIQKGCNEPEVSKYVKSMLEHMNLSGEFPLRIARKILGGGNHHGIEVRNVLINSAIQLKVQYGDNDTRFLCYMYSNEIKPGKLLELFRGELDDMSYKRKDDLPPPRQIKAPEMPQISLTEPSESETREVPVKAKKGTGHLSDYASDPMLRDMIFTAMKDSHGKNTFSSKEFHKIMCGFCGEHQPTPKASGQLIRRLSEAGYAASLGKKGRVRYYRLIDKNGGSAHPFSGPTTNLNQKVLELETNIEELKAAKVTLEEISLQEASCEAEILATKRRLEELELRRKDLIVRKSELQNLISDPQFRDAERKIAAIHKILG